MIRSPAPPAAALRAHAIRLEGTSADYDPLLECVRGRSFVLLGEASHGTHEFYAMRADITRRLIEAHGFDAVVVEGDWPDVARLDRYVRGEPGDADAGAALGDFERFPTWMWRNRPVFAFADWLRTHNAARPAHRRVGMHGMDLYSLYRSANAVIEYLERVDPAQALLAKRVYACLDHVGDPQHYGHEAARGLRRPCRDAAATLLSGLLRNARDYAGADPGARAQQFDAERNARLVLDAEHYYRTMFEGRARSWNLRDAHMADTLFALQAHLRADGRGGRIVVWAHNSHLGDARATAMGARGEWNVGQLVRERAGAADALLVGFTTYAGHVTAARDWDLPAERRRVRPACDGSIERLLYATGLERCFVPLDGAAADVLDAPLLERAIGVVYRPETERASHYFHARVPSQFDALFHVDETDALEPLDVAPHWHRGEPPDTWPTGL